MAPRTFDPEAIAALLDRPLDDRELDALLRRLGDADAEDALALLDDADLAMGAAAGAPEEGGASSPRRGARASVLARVRARRRRRRHGRGVAAVALACLAAAPWAWTRQRGGAGPAVIDSASLGAFPMVARPAPCPDSATRTLAARPLAARPLRLVAARAPHQVTRADSIAPCPR